MYRVVMGIIYRICKKNLSKFLYSLNKAYLWTLSRCFFEVLRLAFISDLKIRKSNFLDVFC